MAATTSAAHPEPYIQEPRLAHENTLIVLHGTSQTGPSFADLFLPYTFPDPSPPTPATSCKITLPQRFPHTRFVFPTGALRPTTVFGGQLSHAWFDVHTFSDRTVGEEDAVPGLRESITYLKALVEQELTILRGAGSADGKVTLLGFSQGCALAVLAVLSGELERLGPEGQDVVQVVGLSGWLPFRREIAEIVAATSSTVETPEAKKRLAIGYVRDLLELEDANPDLTKPWSGVSLWLGHGMEDQKVKLKWGEEMRDVLGDLTIDVSWKTYPGLGHWWCEDEILDFAAFLDSVWE